MHQLWSPKPTGSRHGFPPSYWLVCTLTKLPAGVNINPRLDLALQYDLIVPDRRHRILLKVVLVRRWAIWVLGIWRGVGWEEG